MEGPVPLKNNSAFKRTTGLFFGTLVVAILTGIGGACSWKGDPGTDHTGPSINSVVVEYPSFKMAHISDLHVYDPELGITGEAFEKYLDRDRKMLAHSVELNREVFSQVAKSGVDFVLISGDLTKDGEKKSHLLVQKMIHQLEAQGVSVYVVPGNHDIENGEAFSYHHRDASPVETVSAREFQEIYARAGYEQAIEKDPSSLSYVAEPVSGLWVLALDSNRYKENRKGEHPVTGGRIGKDTLSWVVSVLQKARSSNRAVIAFMHHGLLEHYKHNRSYFSDYVLENGDELSSILATCGVRVVFTGHFHAQDVTVRKWDHSPGQSCDGSAGEGLRIYDLQTGSPVTYPFPYRIVSVQDHTMNIQSRRLASIRGFPHLQREGKKDLIRRTKKMAGKKLGSYFVSPEDVEVLSFWIADSYAKHLSGDEKEVTDPPYPPGEGPGFFAWLALVLQGELIESWQRDLEPEDNTLTIDLK